jgi:adenylylsulfate kinase
LSVSFAVWLTGLPASGKSTVARALAAALAARGVEAEVLESDAVRRVLTPQPGYGRAERDLFYRALGWAAGLLAERGVPVVVDATAPRRRHRDAARDRIPRFLEVFVDTPLEVCMSRDPKGIYRAGREGRAYAVPGLQEPYEEPRRPEVVVDGQASAETGARRVMAALARRGWLARGRPPRPARARTTSRLPPRARSC